MISTIIAKPTKFCNATCTYCSAPPDGAPKWSLDDFKQFFDKLAPHLTDEAIIIWHGGEPMLMGPQFYRDAWAYARSVMPRVRFSMQSNLLSYEHKRWYDVFKDIFDGSVSSSFDPDEQYRVFRGSTSTYTKIFYKRLDAVLADGFRPKVIGTYTEETAPLAITMYEKSLSYGDQAFHLRFNYRYPAGRDQGNGEMLKPESYGRMLLGLYNRWIVDLPDFVITPLDEMLKRVIAVESDRCPWTRRCGGAFMGVEPTGDTYNCSEFADLGDKQFRFGNLRTHSIQEMMSSPAARMAKRRRVNVPQDCVECRHFAQCEGGCMRDAILYDHGIFGKFHYCASWKMVFDRIKQTVRNGEADEAIRKYGRDPDRVRIDQGLVAA